MLFPRRNDFSETIFSFVNKSFYLILALVGYFQRSKYMYKHNIEKNKYFYIWDKKDGRTDGRMKKCGSRSFFFNIKYIWKFFFKFSVINNCYTHTYYPRNMHCITLNVPNPTVLYFFLKLCLMLQHFVLQIHTKKFWFLAVIDLIFVFYCWVIFRRIVIFKYFQF